MAAMRLMDEVSENELNTLQTDLDTLMAVDEAERLHELKWFARQLPNRLSPLLTGQLDAYDDPDIETPE